MEDKYMNNRALFGSSEHGFAAPPRHNPYNIFSHHRATIAYPDWVVRDAKHMFRQFGTVVTTPAVVYSQRDEFKSYDGSTVTILGGGPSTLQLNISKVSTDYLWSCNHFFLNPTLKDIKIDLAMLMAEVDPINPELIKYAEKFSPLLGFEIHDRWMAHWFTDYEKYFFMHTDFYSKLGIGVRMILFASALGCKEVKFCGFDGFVPIYEGSHAFQPGKKTLPSDFEEERYLAQYKYFWHYCQEMFPDTKYTNLGGGDELHKDIR